MYRLHNSGYQAYLVGGGVRDLLLGREPKDFDISTNASPEEVRRVFRNSRLIGRRFRLAHVRYGREIIEVATFRAPHDEGNAGQVDTEGRILRDNVYGDLESDAWRRDFSVNALYYNIADHTVVDYTEGMDDLKAGELRMIGADPVERYREDPVRMLRAVRFAAKLGFNIHPASEKPLFELGYLLDDIPAARLYEEVLKMFLSGQGLKTYEMLRHYGLFEFLFPQTDDSLTKEENDFPITLVNRALKNTDTRVRSEQGVNPAFLYAALLWEPYREEVAILREEGKNSLEARKQAYYEVVKAQQEITALPKRFSYPMREIWEMQSRFEYRQGKRPERLMEHDRFRAAYDFLILRGESGEALDELCEWWTSFQEMNAEERRKATGPEKNRKRKRRKKKPAASGDDSDDGSTQMETDVDE